MANYYEILQVESTASAAEIEAAWETLYNRWRHLVTHHDPRVAEEANRALRTLEQVRRTLTDQAKRAEYDASLNLGGLADPQALLQAVAPPPPPRQLEGAATAPQAATAWVCTACHTPNATGLLYCASCGRQIGRECPRCSKVIAVTAPYCSHCGADVQAALDEKQAARLRELQAKVAQEAAAIDLLRRASRLSFFASPWSEEQKLRGQLWRSSSSYRAAWVFGLSWVVVVLALAFADMVLSFVTAVAGVVVILFWTSAATTSAAESRIDVHQARISQLQDEIKRLQAGG